MPVPLKGSRNGCKGYRFSNLEVAKLPPGKRDKGAETFQVVGAFIFKIGGIKKGKQ